jgi:NADH dehydrogenase [ubiquinone] 1 alpha subcomplex assembly factor 7
VLDADGAIGFAPGKPSAAFALLTPLQREAPPGSIVEVSPAALRLAGDIGRRLAAHGGAGLIVDYGDGATGGSFRAARRHRWLDNPLGEPGAADLTADVDFAALGRAANAAGAGFFGPIPQAVLLQRLGIEPRAARLRAAAPAQAQSIDAAVRRLLAPEEMGTLFKAAAIVGPSFGHPPGFEEEDVVTGCD